jgi:hypothetical protein
MRIPKKFGERTLHFEATQDEKKKYILAFEGHMTEYQYFSGIAENHALIPIDPIIEIYPLIRSFPQLSHSHPLKVIGLLEEHLEKSDSVKVIIDIIVDFLVDHENIADDKLAIRLIKESLDVYFYMNLKYSIDSRITVTLDLLDDLGDYLKRTLNLENQIENISLYIDNQQIVYSPEIDFVCIIVDRDKGSFKNDQYIDMIKKCDQKNYRLFVSNPAFEFWLLLHSDEVFNYNSELLFNNARITKNNHKRFIEKELATIFSGYRKECIGFNRFLPHIRKAINNEKKFCEDIELLKDNLGSNIGLLMAELVKDN